MRDRAEGWRYAKLSGHVNEEELEYKLNNDESLFKELIHRILGNSNYSGDVKVGGKNEKSIPSVLGNRTKSKTDMQILLNDNISINISIKKSLGGQVYLIKTSRFIDGYEKQFKTKIPQDVKNAMMIFWGEHPQIKDLIKTYGESDINSIRDYESRKQRLVASSLYRYNKNHADSLIEWFRENIGEIVLYCFSLGLAEDKSNWANYVWYKNVVGDNNVDSIYSVEDICNKSQENRECIEYGVKTGGTTIQLPFGFVQWHQGQMQFHHQYAKISNMCESI